MNKQKQILISGALVCFFAAIGTGLVSITEHSTHQKIIDNEKLALMNSLFELVNKERFDNDLAEDTILIPASNLLGSKQPQIAYRARKNNQPIAIIIKATASNGYNGAIEMLVAINWNGSLSGVRVVKHKETPGLGDDIEIIKSDWIKQFELKSLNQPESKKAWHVKKDGGDFDQMTGATITPRAIVASVYNSLIYYKENRAILYQ